ncbi:hypothetical protein L6452_02595 [Arctium lappa]|uniref:Uncharacterized protein n=1 Tax=Arctium lappa TaxID=4217 RepID=A0ACB9FL39_ARCLA|nr:hypothetical protein L6452_02595 [Arctium lappa]
MSMTQLIRYLEERRNKLITYLGLSLNQSSAVAKEALSADCLVHILLTMRPDAYSHFEITSYCSWDNARPYRLIGWRGNEPRRKIQTLSGPDTTGDIASSIVAVIVAGV